MNEDDIKIKLENSKLALLHKKKFFKLFKEYKNGNFIPNQLQQEHVEQKQPPPSGALFGTMKGMMGGMSKMLKNQSMQYKHQHQYQHQSQNQDQNQNQNQQRTTEIHNVDINEICPRCNGDGFIHESLTIPHRKPTGIRCIFCKDCAGCQGKGYIKEKQKIITTNSGIFGVSTISQISSINQCPPCKGLGFIHESNCSHSKPPNVKCIFCKTCNACNGSGRI